MKLIAKKKYMLHQVITYLCISNSQNLNRFDVSNSDFNKKNLGSYSIKKIDDTTSIVRLNWFGEILAQFARFFFLKNRFVGWLAKGTVISLNDQQPGSPDRRVHTLLEKLHPPQPQVAEHPSVDQTPLSDEGVVKGSDVITQTIAPGETSNLEDTSTLSSLTTDRIMISHPQQNQQSLLTTTSNNNPIITTPFATDVSETIPPQTKVLQNLNTKFRPLSRFFTEQHLVLKKKGKEKVQTTFQHFLTQKTMEEQNLAKTQQFPLGT